MAKSTGFTTATLALLFAFFILVASFGKSSWPELVGATEEGAAARIERKNPHVDAIVLLDRTPTTKDYRCNRVWGGEFSRGCPSTSPSTIG